MTPKRDAKHAESGAASEKAAADEMSEEDLSRLSAGLAGNGIAGNGIAAGPTQAPGSDSANRIGSPLDPGLSLF